MLNSDLVQAKRPISISSLEHEPVCKPIFESYSVVAEASVNMCNGDTLFVNIGDGI